MKISDPDFSQKKQGKIFITEKWNKFSDESGFVMNIQEVSFKNIDLKWGSYINPAKKPITIYPNKPGIVSHFQLNESVIKSTREGLRENEFTVYRESQEPYEIDIAPTGKDSRLFFELKIDDNLFKDLLNEESTFLTRFSRYKSVNTLSPKFTSKITTDMNRIIQDMQSTKYVGQLKMLYLETKSIELFLAQVYQLDNAQKNKFQFKGNDIDILNYIKRFIDSNYLLPLSILDLSIKAGINQTKLKFGFKQLFGHTVFGYIADLRLNEAKRLLTEEKMYINEVAEKIGYKHAHHFTVAFKKKFGILPSHLTII